MTPITTTPAEVEQLLEYIQQAEDVMDGFPLPKSKYWERHHRIKQFVESLREGI